jgi:hypothetical protein
VEGGPFLRSGSGNDTLGWGTKGTDTTAITETDSGQPAMPCPAPDHAWLGNGP